MGFKEYDRYDGLGLGELIAKKEVSALEVVDAAIARAEALNPKLNAIVFAAYDDARARARANDFAGPFRGVPTLLKDMRGGAVGMPTRSGSRMMPAIPAKTDSNLVARFRASGLVPLGKTNVPEFGILPTTESKLYGPARNPWNLAHSTGGSSGGSGAAVAAGIVPIAHATDGGGSIRIPAACNGLVGLKVSRGRVSQGPDASDSTLGLSVDNVVTRTVRDTAAVLDHISVPDYGDPYFAPPREGSYLEAIARPPRRLRIAYQTRRSDGQPYHPDVEIAMRAALEACEGAGHILEEAIPDADQQELATAFMTLWAAATGYGVEALSRATGVKPSLEVVEGITLSLYERGKTVLAMQQTWAQQVLYRYARTMARFHETYDVWLMPTLATPPLKLGVVNVDEQDLDKAFAPMIDYAPFTAVQNGSGQAAINLPFHWNADNLPIGLQFVGRNGSEMLLLQLAAQLEQIVPWAHRRPEIATRT